MPVSAIRRFLRREAAGGILLSLAAILAMIVANSTFAGTYRDVLHTYVGPLSVIHWINDGLMALFFLLVGLEIKRELVDGHLATWSDRALPSLAALGGMAVPALIYLGVAHTLADDRGRRLVIDIGGGSTEMIVGERFEALRMDSLGMGCVGYSLRFFGETKVRAEDFRKAELAARLKLEPIERRYCDAGWTSCVGASGTITAWDCESWFAARGGRPGYGTPGNVITGVLAGFEPAAFSPNAAPAPPSSAR